MPSAAAIRDDLHKKQDALGALFAKSESIDEMPADDAKLIKPMNDEITLLAKSLEEAEAKESIRDNTLHAIEGRKVAPGNPIARGGGGGEPAQIKTLGQILNESKSYEAFRRRDTKTAVIELSEHEWANIEQKTLITLTTINNMATRAPGIQTSAQEERTVADLMLQGSTDNNTLSYMVETTFTNAAAEVAEGGTKPESALAFTERTDSVRKIATWIPMTDEAMNDVKGLESYVRGRLAFMVKRREETELLTGDGIAPNIQGILNRAGIQTQAKGADPVPDAVYKAMTLVRNTGFAEPTAYVTHPTDWQDVRLLRTADGIYIWGSPADAGPDRIWGLEVRVTSAMTLNTGLVGAFRPMAQIFRREGITLTISTEHSTFFIENKVAILAESRLGLACYRPSAFASVTGI